MATCYSTKVVKIKVQPCWSTKEGRTSGSPTLTEINTNICAEKRAQSLTHHGSRPEAAQGMYLVADVFVRILASNKETRANTAAWI